MHNKKNLFSIAKEFNHLKKYVMKNEILVPAIFTFDETECHFKGLHNPKSGWNGWYMPYIHEDSINDFISIVSTNEDNYQLEGDSLHVTNYECGHVVYSGVIEPTIIEGGKYYNLGFEGLCFDIVK